MFKNAIVRQPAKSLATGITTSTLGLPDYQRAVDQHTAYIKALQACGLEVKVLAAQMEFPDSVFVEDAALLTPHCAILTRPGADSRKGEVALIEAAVRRFYQTVYQITSPGTLEAGDVMMVGSHYYIGLSERTNIDGANQLIDFLARHDMTGSVVEMSEFLHLKTGLSYLENNTMLLSGEFVGRKEFENFKPIIIDVDEQYAANSVWINDCVLTPTGYPQAAERIRQAGYQLIELDMSEFQKLDGGLSCLSLRF